MESSHPAAGHETLGTQPDAEELLDLLQRVTRQLVGVTARAFASQVGSTRLTLPAYRLLVLVTTKGPERPSALAAELEVTPAAVTQMVRLLVRSGLVETRSDPTDRRRRTITVTAAGSSLVESIAAERARRLRPVLDSFRGEDREKAVELLDRLDRALSEAEPRP